MMRLVASAAALALVSGAPAVAQTVSLSPRPDSAVVVSAVQAGDLVARVVNNRVSAVVRISRVKIQIAHAKRVRARTSPACTS